MKIEEEEEDKDIEVEEDDVDNKSKESLLLKKTTPEISLSSFNGNTNLKINNKTKNDNQSLDISEAGPVKSTYIGNVRDYDIPQTGITSLAQNLNQFSKNFIPSVPIQPKSIKFSFLSEEEILQLSVKKITKAVNFSTLGNPIEDGLYDPALGPIGDDRTKTICTTCGLLYPHCPGHIGHISLPVPLYNPVLFKLTGKILRYKCLHCDHLRLPRYKARYFQCKLLLLKAGLFDLAASLEKDLLGKNFSVSDNDNESVDDNNKIKNGDNDDILVLNEKKDKKSKETNISIKNMSIIQDNLRIDAIFADREAKAFEALGLLNALEEMNRQPKVIDHFSCMSRIESINQPPS